MSLWILVSHSIINHSIMHKFVKIHISVSLSLQGFLISELKTSRNQTKPKQNNPNQTKPNHNCLMISVTLLIFFRMAIHV